MPIAWSALAAFPEFWGLSLPPWTKYQSVLASAPFVIFSLVWKL
jgi:hypothetical protein